MSPTSSLSAVGISSRALPEGPTMTVRTPSRPATPSSVEPSRRSTLTVTARGSDGAGVSVTVKRAVSPSVIEARAPSPMPPRSSVTSAKGTKGASSLPKLASLTNSKTSSGVRGAKSRAENCPRGFRSSTRPIAMSSPSQK